MGYASLPPSERKKLTKAELLELANFLYSRYEGRYQKKLLNRKFGGMIIKMDTNHVKFNK